ncbi:MAG TPA: glycoside hydrolase family 9 protein, partial [Candidatus Goldiibacteriota bacterium]|nr:glycoside hydrolase family 9 protein [Candidatus Goldiibacteriota bacterium]
MKRTIVTMILLAMAGAAGIYAANSDIRLNSIGYKPQAPKKASVKSSSPATFYVRSYPSGPTRLTATTTLYGVNADTSETIYIADFSSVTEPGTYNVQVNGIGTSANFTISEDVFDFSFYTVFRGFYLWRCGTAVSGTHNSTTFSHAACHLNDAYLTYVGGGNVKVDGTGGWHDAGDYNKYVTNANVTFGVLGKAWEYLRGNFEGINLNLPETAPGYPQYLKELKWETDWLLKMQTPDGRVYHKLSSTSFCCDWTMPENNGEARFYVPYSTAATADFVAMMAQAYRLFMPYDPTYANQCLDAARLSYGRITTAPDNVNVPANQTGFSTGSYATTDTDDRIWAAAEMWESTGEALFLADFEARAIA